MCTDFRKSIYSLGIIPVIRIYRHSPIGIYTFFYAVRVLYDKIRHIYLASIDICYIYKFINIFQPAEKCESSEWRAKV